MTETEWLKCRDFVAMLEFLRGEPCEEQEIDGIASFVVEISKGLLASLAQPMPSFPDRKWRLFNCACCREIWPLLERACCQSLVETSEKYADGLIEDSQRLQAVRDAEELYHAASHDLRQRAIAAAWGTLDLNAAEGAYEVAETAALALADAIDMNLIPGTTPMPDHPKGWVCDRLREIFGTPFRPVCITPSWLTTNVVFIARSIYDKRGFEDMPILGDALEDAGCDNASILEHCRGGGGHVRGCWVVDLVLGKI